MFKPVVRLCSENFMLYCDFESDGWYSLIMSLLPQRMTDQHFTIIFFDQLTDYIRNKAIYTLLLFLRMENGF